MSWSSRSRRLTARMKEARVSVEASRASPHISLLNLKGSSKTILKLGKLTLSHSMDSTK